MAENRAQSNLPRQEGAAGLLFVAVIFIGTSYWLLETSVALNARAQTDRVTAASMALAKEALIGRAAADANRPGSLPCPDSNGDGIADLFNGSECPAYLGRLPWKTLDIPEPRDGYGEGLWYALSRGLRDHPAAQPINPAVALEITLDGTPNIAAIIFSPGMPLPQQIGRPSSVVTDYLEGSNSDGDNAYVSGPVSGIFNDRALAISRDAIFRLVNQRVLGEIRGPDAPPGGPTYGLRAYFATNAAFPLADSGGDGYGDTAAPGKLPFNDIDLHAAAALPPYTWLSANGWLSLVGYQRIAVDAARITLGSNKMDVRPCPASPCL